jgi:subtilisin family serine protease
MMVGTGITMIALLVTAPLLQGASQAGASELGPRAKVEPFKLSARPSNRLSPAGTQAGKPPIESSYYYDGKRVVLERSDSELSVRFVSDRSSRSSGALVHAVSSAARVRAASSLRGLSMQSVTLPRAGRASLDDLLAGLRAKSSVEFAYPAWIDPETGERLLPTDEVVAGLRRGASPARIERALEARGLAIEQSITYSSDEYVLRLVDPKHSDPLSVSRELFESGLARWAEPNFVQQWHKDFVPDDPLFAQQWALQNTGQTGGVVGADARLTGAWDIERGKPSITIAVIDDGVQLSHPDLAPNIYTNKQEIPGNHIDDDHDGFVDDLHGWNFVADNNQVGPLGTGENGDNHGTAVAGVAAARGNNSIGISGACPQCTILPVKISSENEWASDADIADAIRYAASKADVLNLSWGGDEPSAAIALAIEYAVTNGRNGKGAIPVAAAGNDASGFVDYTLADIPAGTYRFRWSYSKDFDDTFPVGDDTAWLSWARFDGGSIENFEQATGGLPLGWTTGGDAGSSWSIVDDPAHADESRCWSHSAKAGKISNNQTTYIETVRTFPQEGDLVFDAFVSSEEGRFHFITGDSTPWPLDGLILWVDQGDDGTYDWESEMLSGVPPSGLSFPASFGPTIAVGASSELDCRDAYSRFGPPLDLVAPSGGGLAPGIVTTDRTGKAGYAPGSYYPYFGGTSSTSPLTAGVAGLILSRNPGLTEQQVEQILEGSADKVEPDLAQYDSNGHSDRYGFGRLDAEQALEATPLPATISFSRPRLRVIEGQRATITIRRTGDLSLPATARLTTIGETAKAKRDFAKVTRTIDFVPNQRSQTITVETYDNDLHQRNRKLYLKLSSSSPGASLASPSIETLTIVDNDPRFGEIAAARLSRDLFDRSQAQKVYVDLRFEHASGRLELVLSRKKEGRWKLIRRVDEVGDFKGSYTLSLSRLFAGKPMKAGAYRLRLRADENSKELAFRIR